MADIFRPVRGTEEQINSLSVCDGYIYFAYNTGNIYLDKNGHRYLMGGNSTGIFYSHGNDEQILKVFPDNDTNYEYTMSFSALENNSVPLVNSLILNNTENQIINVTLLAVSGSGGGPVAPVDPDVRINLLNNTYDYMSFIYGQDSYIEFIPEADRDSFVTLYIVISFIHMYNLDL